MRSSSGLSLKPSSATLATYMVGLAVSRKSSRKVGALVVGQVHRAHRPALVQMRQHALQQRLARQHGLVAGLGLLDGLVQGLADGLHVRQGEFGVDDLDVADRVDAAGHVHHVVVFEAAHHMGDGVGLADVGQELVAEPLALGRAGDQPGDVDELHRGGDDLGGLADGGDDIEPRIGQRHDADVGVDGAERIVLGRDAGLGQRVEEGGLADVGQSDDAAFESHGCSIPKAGCAKKARHLSAIGAPRRRYCAHHQRSDQQPSLASRL
jgi:hypothetical protein